MLRTNAYRQGGTLLMTLLFVVMFVIIFLSLTQLINLQYKQSVLFPKREAAYYIAEAGLNFAKWRFMQNPDNNEAVEQTMYDADNNPIGSFSVTVTPFLSGDSHVQVVSTGTAASGQEVTLRALLGPSSLAGAAYVTNRDAWYSASIKGPIFSNGGIRMDGDTDNAVISARQSYRCFADSGCTGESKAGVWGVADDTSLWRYPASGFDFRSITATLLNIKKAAQSNGSYYGFSGHYGYHLVFNTDGTYDVYQVDTVKPMIRSYSSVDGWQYASHDIDTQSLIETKTVPDDGLLFFEDRVWIEGDITGRVTVGAASFPYAPATERDIIINGNITYGEVRDGTRSFAAVAQRNIVIPYYAAPDILSLDGAYVAGTGVFGRRLYESGDKVVLNRLNRYGLVVSNYQPETLWINDAEQVQSGYISGEEVYDMFLPLIPPVLFPSSGLTALSAVR